MDVRNWPLERKMALPDYCFGRRYPVCVSLDLETDETDWDISEVALPDIAVVHELCIDAAGGFGNSGLLRLALGDQLPTVLAEMARLQPLFAGLGLQGPEPRQRRINFGASLSWSRLRVPVAAQGRRLVMELVTVAPNIMAVNVCIVVSALPTEVPDCLISV